MSYNAVITDPYEADAMPMWESFDHADLDDAFQVAQTYIHATQPGDRVVDEGHGVYGIYGVYAVPAVAYPEARELNWPFRVPRTRRSGSAPTGPRQSSHSPWRARK
jgi:hypothetical protein